jgi:hypothetical protein
MTQSAGTPRRASYYGPISGRWLQEEFDDVGRDLKDAKAISVPEAHAEDAVARTHEWRDETDYDDPGAGSGCWECPSPFPDNHDLITGDSEK